VSLTNNNIALKANALANVTLIEPNLRFAWKTRAYQSEPHIKLHSNDELLGLTTNIIALTCHTTEVITNTTSLLIQYPSRRPVLIKEESSNFGRTQCGYSQIF
jgi:hypothetical protein